MLYPRYQSGGEVKEDSGAGEGSELCFIKICRKVADKRGEPEGRHGNDPEPKGRHGNDPVGNGQVRAEAGTRPS